MEIPAPKTPDRPKGVTNTNRILQTSISIAVLLATLFTAFPLESLSAYITGRLGYIFTPQPESPLAAGTPQQELRIGIIAGHWGYDSGAVCDDGTTEMDVNLTIATLVKQKLSAHAVTVDLLEEFDLRLPGYQALALISIHNDSCEYKNDQATGFKIAAKGNITDPNRASRLAACLRDRYQRTTNLPFHAGSITEDMTDYHAFNKISPSTTAVIIETGFMNLDYDLLVRHPDLVADGIVAGVLCYINNEGISSTPTPFGLP